MRCVIIPVTLRTAKQTHQHFLYTVLVTRLSDALNLTSRVSFLTTNGIHQTSFLRQQKRKIRRLEPFVAQCFLCETKTASFPKYRIFLEIQHPFSLLLRPVARFSTTICPSSSELQFSHCCSNTAVVCNAPFRFTSSCPQSGTE